MSNKNLNFYDSRVYHELVTLPGDLTPTDFSFNMALTDTHLMGMYIRNEYVQIACDWMPAEALRKWLTFRSDTTPVQGLKHGKEHPFKNFDEYFEWIGGREELENCFGWSRLFGRCIMFHMDAQEAIDMGAKTLRKGQTYTLGKSADGRYLACRAFHPFCQTEEGGNGYEVGEVDQTTGKPLTYKIHIMTKGMKHERVIIADPDRVVEFNWKRKQIKYGGDSRVRGLALLALCEEQMFKRLMKRLHDLAGGVRIIPGIKTAEQMTTFMASDAGANDQSSVDTIGVDRPENAPAYITPDLKTSTEFIAAFDMFTRKICRHTHLSQKILDGESQGVQASAQFDMMSSYTEIFQMQNRFKQPMESVFYKLGLEDTEFDWVPILPEEMQPDFKFGGLEGFGKGEGGFGDKEDKDKEDKQKEEKPNAPQS